MPTGFRVLKSLIHHFELLLARQCIIVLAVVLLVSCSDRGMWFEKAYYEKISDIKFPDNYEVIESFDNGEWLTGAVLIIEHSTLEAFISDNYFDTLQSSNDLMLKSNSYLANNKADFKIVKNVYYISRSRGKNHWVYAADLNRNILWAEISYPDWGGK